MNLGTSHTSSGTSRTTSGAEKYKTVKRVMLVNA